uniref:NADH-ubiquinone oxidoreductase chain 5 n=1 Tax=Epiperipatus biolleyi TaxID=172520 RepID=A3QU30_EPIBI|nr:NADH dehydrogenase subunit 5 [Epiperipatus biolleyi]ABF93300.1 NADH dehydrogenase subunit 5 [Epiperipatus biolleyi]
MLFLLFFFGFLISLIFCNFKFVYIFEIEFLEINSNSIIMTMIFDWMSVLFMTVIFFISGSVMKFSVEYMMEEKNKLRFCMIVIMFILSMIFLVISPNLISILLGWDGLGLVSYVLVIYYQNSKSNSAGMLTILSNRVGDVAFFNLYCIYINYHGNWNFFSLSVFDKNIISVMVVLMLLAGITKSAQIPFSAWLPAAMAAPTPVSALVHSSTLVTAGVFLMIRFSEFFSSMMFFKVSLLFMSSLTMMMASVVANFEFDIKKNIALSTLSQLGLMMSIVALGFPNLAFFHLLTHAVFKALLFICSGSIIHNFGHVQDIRMLGLVTNQMPKVSICLNIANLSLCGIPFLAGFYSKDIILEMYCYSNWNFISFIMLFIATSMTASYSIRMAYFSLWKKIHSKSMNSIFEGESEISSSAMLMSMGAVVGGSVFSWLIFSSPNSIELFVLLKVSTLIVTFAGGMYMLSVKEKNYFLGEKMKFIFYFFSQMWFFPKISSQIFLNFMMSWSKFSFENVDISWVEMLGLQGTFKVLVYSSKILQSIQKNSIKTYLFSMIIIMFVCWMF